MSKFKIGEEVKGKDNLGNNFNEGIIRGYEYKLPAPYLVEWDTPYGRAKTWCYEDELELVKSYEVKEEQNDIFDQFMNYAKHNLDLFKNESDRKAIYNFVRLYEKFKGEN